MFKWQKSHKCIFWDSADLVGYQKILTLMHCSHDRVVLGPQKTNMESENGPEVVYIAFKHHFQVLY